ncbi:MAG TPA: hypothetical protein VEY08_16385, partial [Chloroflexia bacterium]|nr:hypothetical protein [Chloroflexia bacterium]
MLDLSPEEREQQIAQKLRLRSEVLAEGLKCLQEAFTINDEILALTVGGPSMFDTLLQGGGQLALATSGEITPFDWTDSMTSPMLDARPPASLKTFHQDNLPEAGGRGFMGLTFIELGANNIQSSNVSAVACEFRRDEIQAGQFLIEGRPYVRFKGGGLYRYRARPNNPVFSTREWRSLVGIMLAMAQGRSDTLTVGEYVSRMFVKPADAGDILCEKLEAQEWVIVPPKAERPKPQRKGGGKGKK